MLATQSPGLYIVYDDIKKRCVHCAEDIEKGSLIELAPVIIIPKAQVDVINKTVLYDYYFVWDMHEGSIAIALGYGSLYNHSDEPNADFEVQLSDGYISFRATKDIVAGDEILVDYISLKDAGAQLWFDPK